MKEIIAFVCDFCPRKKRFAQRGTASRHEARCFYNPARKACATCIHFNFSPYLYENETGYGEGGPECAKGLFNQLDDEHTTELRADCEGWEPKSASIVSIAQVRAN